MAHPPGRSASKVQDGIEHGHNGQGGQAAEEEPEGVLPVPFEEFELGAGKQQLGTRALRLGPGPWWRAALPARGNTSRRASLRPLIPPPATGTSGQVLWVWRYLGCRKKREAGLRAQLAEDIEHMTTFRNPDVDLAMLSFWGKPGIYRPAGNAYVADAWQNARKSLEHLLFGRQQFVTRRLLEIVPCRLLVSDFPDSFFENISDVFNKEPDIGVVFNSYNP